MILKLNEDTFGYCDSFSESFSKSAFRESQRDPCGLVFKNDEIDQCRKHYIIIINNKAGGMQVATITSIDC